VKRALVTGGCGFLGSRLASALERTGWEVRLLDRVPSLDGRRGERELVRADVRDRAAVRAAARGCEVVVDNAALVPVTRSTAEEYRSVNVEGCRAALDAAEAEGAFALHISSSAIYGIPRAVPVTPSTPLVPFEPYGRSKAAAERLVAERRAGGLPVASLRPRTLLGPERLGVFDIVFARVRAGGRVPVFGGGANRIQLCDVEDFCAAALAAIDRRANDDYNIGARTFGTVREDIEALIAHAGSAARVQPVPVWAIRAVLEPLAALGRSPFNEWHWRSAPTSFFFDTSKAGAELGWRARHSNVEALARAYDGYVKRSVPTGGSAHLQPLSGALARALRGRSRS